MKMAFVIGVSLIVVVDVSPLVVDVGMVLRIVVVVVVDVVLRLMAVVVVVGVVLLVVAV